MRRFALIALPLALVVSLAAVARVSAGQTNEQWTYTVGFCVHEVAPVGSTGPLVDDRVVLLSETGAPFGQITFTLDRVYNPDTMRGVVSGTVQSFGPGVYTGDLHGVVTPNGMGGTFSFIWLADPDVYRITGTWKSDGQPVAAVDCYSEPNTYTLTFDGHVFGPFNT
jgi:hypothetical protein